MLIVLPFETFEFSLTVVVPLRKVFVTLKVLLAVPVLSALPVQYKPAYTIFEQFGFAPFSVDNAKSADEELKVGIPSGANVVSPSTSTYTIVLLLFKVVLE